MQRSATGLETLNSKINQNIACRAVKFFWDILRCTETVSCEHLKKCQLIIEMFTGRNFYKFLQSIENYVIK